MILILLARKEFVMAGKYEKNNTCIYENKYCEYPAYKKDLGLCIDFCIPSKGKSWEFQKMNKKYAEKFIKKERLNDSD